jgi:hypothetical protein
LWQWLNSPEDYYTKYVLGLFEPPSPKMLLGTIFSDAYSGLSRSQKDPNLPYDWRLALKYPQNYYKDAPDHLTYTSDYERKMEKALKHPELVQAESSNCERTILVETDICSLQAKNDAYIPSQNLVIENKYGMPWTKERVNLHDQLTFYSYVVYLKHGKIPLVRLQSVNSANGEVKAFEIKKKKKDFVELRKKIKYAYEGINNSVFKL